MNQKRFFSLYPFRVAVSLISRRALADTSFT